MNDTTDSPSKEMHQKVTSSKSAKSKDKTIDLDSKIPAIKQAIYNHYGKPNNVVKENSFTTEEGQLRLVCKCQLGMKVGGKKAGLLSMSVMRKMDFK
mgnify:CR=1 FL=1